MKTRFTPHLVDLCYNAALKSFWFKRGLRKFLRECGISQTYLNSWASDESKRDFLDRLFEKLSASDNGRLVIVKMAKSLIEQTCFPDLVNLEDSSDRISDAEKAISELTKYLNRQEEKLQSSEDRTSAQKRWREYQEKARQNRNTLETLSGRLTELSNEIGTQAAGYAFQEWFYDLVDFFEISCRRPYVHAGRQIDGSITIGDTTYLVELKFTTEQTSVTDIDSFYKKVTEKADNTMGIMLSMAGYTSVVKVPTRSDSFNVVGQYHRPITNCQIESVPLHINILSYPTRAYINRLPQSSGCCLLKI